MAEARLLFGEGGNPAFSDFLDRCVTPRFPAGLTVVNASGPLRSRGMRNSTVPARVCKSRLR